MLFFLIWFSSLTPCHSQNGFSGTGYGQATAVDGDGYEQGFDNSVYSFGDGYGNEQDGTSYGQGYATGYLSPDISTSATQFPDASIFPGIPDQFSTPDYNNSVYGSLTISPTDYSYPSFTSNYNYSNFLGGSGLCSNDANDYLSLYPRNWDENSTDASFGSYGGYSDCSEPSAITCENKTLSLKNRWFLPTGHYVRNQSCLYRIKIPANSYAIAEIQFESFDKSSWFKFDNTLGYSFVKMAGNVSLPPTDFQFYLHLYEESPSFNNKITKFNIQTISICNRDYALPTGDSTILNKLAYVGSIAQNIFVLEENGTKAIVLDTLHSNYFNTQIFPSQVLLYPGFLPDLMPCVFFALPLSRKEDFQQMKVALAGSGQLEDVTYEGDRARRPSKEFTLNATERQSCLVLISREKDMEEDGTTFVGAWLLPVVLPKGATLRIFSDFPSKIDNTSQLLHEFGNDISSPAFLGGFVRTLVLDSGTVRVKIAEFLEASKVDRLILNYTNSLKHEKQLIGFSGMGTFTLTVTDGDGNSSTPDARLILPATGWGDDEFDLLQSNGTVFVNKTNPKISLYPGTRIELNSPASLKECLGLFVFLVVQIYR